AGEMLAVDPRLVVVAVDVGVGDEATEVPVADEILCEEDQVEGLGGGLALLLGHRPAGDVRLDANDRLDALRLRRLVERDGPVEGAVVRQGKAVEAPRRRRIDQIRDPPEAVEQTELGVDVEVREVVRGEGRHGTPMVPGWAAGSSDAPTRRVEFASGPVPESPRDPVDSREGPVARTRASALVRVLVAALLALLVAPSSTASGTEREQLRVRVYVLDFDPLMDTGAALTVDRGWTSPIALDEEYRSDVRIASGRVVDQRIVRTSVVRGYPVK